MSIIGESGCGINNVKCELGKDKIIHILTTHGLILREVREPVKMRVYLAYSSLVLNIFQANKFSNISSYFT